MKKMLLTLMAMAVMSLSAVADDNVVALDATDISDASIAIDTLDGLSLDADALASQTENKSTDAEEACYYGGYYGHYGCGYNYYSCYRPHFYCYRPVYTYVYTYPVYHTYWGCY